MQTIKTLLLATDLNPAHQAALTAATMRLAVGLEAQVDLLYVIEPLRHFQNPALIHSYTHSQERFAEQGLTDLKQRLEDSNVSVGDCPIVRGPVSESIVSMATQLNAELIVLGAGNVSTNRAVGLTAQSVIEQAEQPVLVIHPDFPNHEFRTILCPVDHSSVSRRGLRNAIRLAKVLGAKLIVLSVIPDVSWLTAAAEIGEITDVKAEYELHWGEELDRFMATISFDGVAHSLELERGVPHERIIAAARKYSADLIVMGATGRSGLMRALLGSTARRVLRDLPCSMLTVRQQDVVEDEELVLPSERHDS